MASDKPYPTTDCETEVEGTGPLHVGAFIRKITREHRFCPRDAFATVAFIQTLQIDGAVMGLGVVIFTVRVEVEQDLFLDYHFLMAAESAPMAFRFPVSGE